MIGATFLNLSSLFSTGVIDYGYFRKFLLLHTIAA